MFARFCRGCYTFLAIIYSKNMTTKHWLPIASLATLLTLTGASCIKSQNSTGSLNGPNGSRMMFGTTEKDSGGDLYKQAVDLEMPDAESAAGNKELQNIASDVFGSVKVSSYFQMIPGQRGVTVEYTSKRVTEAGDVNAITKALKSRGYAVDQSAVSDGSAVIFTHNKEYNVMFNFSVGGQKIGASLSETVPADDSQSSS